MLSLLTFRRWVGLPQSWIIFSDGLTPMKMRDLLQANSVASLRSWELSKPLVSGEADFLFEYAHNHAWANALSPTRPSLRVPTLFLDSDVVFYAKAAELLSPAFAGPQNWFLPDMDWGTLDTRFLATNSRDLYQSNGGFYLLKPASHGNRSWIFEQLDNRFEYFSEQTAFHVAFKQQGVMALDPRFSFCIATTSSPSA